MTEFNDFTLAPLRKFLGPVYDAYRKTYDYLGEILVPGHQVSTIEGTPLPDVAEGRSHKFYYSVYGAPDNPVKAGIIGQDTKVRTQGTESELETEVKGIGCLNRPVAWMQRRPPMKEIFVEMPYELNTHLPCSTVATKHS